jgi:hypothetical protein
MAGADWAVCLASRRQVTDQLRRGPAPIETKYA